MSWLSGHQQRRRTAIYSTYSLLSWTLPFLCAVAFRYCRPVAAQSTLINTSGVSSTLTSSIPTSSSLSRLSATAAPSLSVNDVHSVQVDHSHRLPPLVNPEISPPEINATGCPNNCSGIGVCLPTGVCDCPLPKIPSWWRAYGPDCRKTLRSYGYAWPYFRYSWLLVYTLALLLLTFFNYNTFKANDWHLGGVRHICLCLVHTAILSRFVFFTIDPYSVNSFISPIVARMLLSWFYLFFILAYVIMALHWVDICRTALALTPFKTLRFAHIGAVLLVVSFVSLQVFITISQLQQIRNRKLLFADTFCMAVIMGLMIPLYLYYGCLFVGRLKMVRKDKEGKRDYLIRKIRVMSFGPAVAGILSILMLVIKLICLHKNPFLFLIGESINHFTELIAVALFLYGILLDASVKGTPFLMKKSTISWSFRTA